MLISDKSRLPLPARPNWPQVGRYRMALLLLLLGASSHGHATPASATSEPKNAAANATIASNKPTSKNMHITIGTRRIAVTLDNSATSRAFAEQLPLTLRMADHNRNEKHAQLPRALPKYEARPGTIRSGDLMLYGSTTLVLFYETFDSSYEYTRLGRVNDPEGLAAALGSREILVKFSMEKM